MLKLPELLICDDDSSFHLAVKYCLKGRYECRSAYNGDEALAILKKNSIPILLLDVEMRTPDEGLIYLPKILETDPNLQIIMSSGRTDFNTVKEAMRLGASDYISKDFDPNELFHLIHRVVERKNLFERTAQQGFEIATEQKQHELIGETPQVRELRKVIEKIKNGNANVVITGETGTGKEVVARQMRSLLKDGTLVPFVAIDSSTIQNSMAESILFGHEKGAFTGAERASKGLFEEAHGGIVYFDEIGNMPLEIQAKLLRVLQEKEVVRLGSSKVLQLEFRVVCATNQDLESRVAEGRFKDDLLQRLNVLPIHVHPLRDRIDDIPLLVQHFAKRLKPKNGVHLKFSEESLDLLKRYPWPGNIRELSNLISYVGTMVEGPEVEIADLPQKYRNFGQTRTNGKAFYDRVAEFESKILREEYAKKNGSVSQLALELGMDRSHLYSKLKEYGIHSARVK